MSRFTTGYVARIRKKDGSRFRETGWFCHHSEPFPTRREAEDWAAAFGACDLVDVHEETVPAGKLVREGC